MRTLATVIGEEGQPYHVYLSDSNEVIIPDEFWDVSKVCVPQLEGFLLRLDSEADDMQDPLRKHKRAAYDKLVAVQGKRGDPFLRTLTADTNDVQVTAEPVLTLAVSLQPQTEEVLEPI